MCGHLTCRLDKLANLFAILRALEFLEMAFVRNILVDDEYGVPRVRSHTDMRRSAIGCYCSRRYSLYR